MTQAEVRGWWRTDPGRVRLVRLVNVNVNVKIRFKLRNIMKHLSCAEHTLASREKYGLQAAHEATAAERRITEIVRQ